MLDFFISRGVVLVAANSSARPSAATFLEDGMVRMLRARVVTVVGAACCLAAGVVVGAPALSAAAAAAASSAVAVYVPVGPVRVLDTRNGTGGQTGPVVAGGTISLQVDGTGVVPSTGVTAVVLNVTATDGTADSYVTVYPAGGTRPTASNLNFSAGETIPNLVTVPVGADGAVTFYNHAGSVDLVADLAGYYTSTGIGSLLDTVGPMRVLDTRNGTGAPRAQVGGNSQISLQVEGAAGVPGTGVTAVVLNVTATDTTANSYVTVYPDGQPKPTASNLNFSTGETIPNQVVVPVGTDGKVDFYNHTGSVDLVADLSGYYTAAGAGFTPLGPVRVLDTRNGTGAPQAPVGGNSSISLPVEGVAGVPASGVTAVVLNVTATDPTASSYVTVYADGGTRPTASSLNFTPGETIPNLVVVPVGADGNVDFYNHTGSVDLVADLAGYYTSGGWGAAIPVPGSAALNIGGYAFVSSVSCPSAGNCTAGGQYAASSFNASPSDFQAFVTDEVSGTWGAATQVPGTAALNTADTAGVTSVSCPSVGNCAAVGYYNVSTGGSPAFVAEEVNGKWGNAIEIPGIATLSTGGDAYANSVSCASAGNCTIGGYYLDSSNNNQAFVADEAAGIWGDATEVPGTGALNTGNSAQVTSVSCPSAGNCTAGGVYFDSSFHGQAFVADEVSGSWHTAIEVPGTGALNTGIGTASSVSCGSAGNCTVGGDYVDSSGHSQAFVADEASGVWGDAIEVPATAALNAGGSGEVLSVSCPSAGNCAVGGDYTDGSGVIQAFVADEVSGAWGSAIEVPGTAGGGDAVFSVSCGSAGNCAAATIGVGGTGPSSSGALESFVVDEVNGTWGEAIPVPGLSGTTVQAVSCPSTGACAAGGLYSDTTSGGVQALVVSQN